MPLRLIFSNEFGKNMDVLIEDKSIECSFYPNREANPSELNEGRGTLNNKLHLDNAREKRDTFYNKLFIPHLMQPLRADLEDSYVIQPENPEEETSHQVYGYSEKATFKFKRVIDLSIVEKFFLYQKTDTVKTRPKLVESYFPFHNKEYVLQEYAIYAQMPDQCKNKYDYYTVTIPFDTPIPVKPTQQMNIPFVEKPLESIVTPNSFIASQAIPTPPNPKNPTFFDTLLSYTNIRNFSVFKGKFALEGKEMETRKVPENNRVISKNNTCKGPI